MPTVSEVGAVWVVPVRATRTTATSAVASRVPIERRVRIFMVVAPSVEPVDALLGVDPLLEVAGVGPLALRPHPGLVRLLRLVLLIVEHAEVDERLGRRRAEVPERRDLLGAHRQHRLVVADAAIDVAGGVLAALVEGLARGALLAVAPVIVRDV